MRHKQIECGKAVALKNCKQWIIDRENLDIKEDIILTNKRKMSQTEWTTKKKVVGYFPETSEMYKEAVLWKTKKNWRFTTKI